MEREFGMVTRELQDELRDRWPMLRVNPEVLAQVGQRCEGLHKADVLFASLLGNGIPDALDAFEKVTLVQVTQLLKRKHAEAVVDDAVQWTRSHLLVPHEDGTLRVAQYSGDGSLRAWVLAIASRRVVELTRAEERYEPWSEALERGDFHSVEWIEFEMLRNSHRAEFKEAFKDAFESLTRRERILLRMELVEGMAHEKIARIFHTHRMTIVRWLGAAKNSLKNGTLRSLQARGFTDTELSSLARVLVQQTDLSLRRMLIKGTR